MEGGSRGEHMANVKKMPIGQNDTCPDTYTNSVLHNSLSYRIKIQSAVISNHFRTNQRKRGEKKMSNFTHRCH
jgi:hypothetical protein